MLDSAALPYSTHTGLTGPRFASGLRAVQKSHVGCSFAMGPFWSTTSALKLMADIGAASAGVDCTPRMRGAVTIDVVVSRFGAHAAATSAATAKHPAVILTTTTS